MNTNTPLTLQQLYQVIHNFTQQQLNQVQITAEISGFTLASSGHAYLKLKDKELILDAVIWKTTYQQLKLKPENGLQVIITGNIQAYENRSTLQMMITALQPVGLGSLHQLYELNKQYILTHQLHLHKKPLPFLPTHLGIITALKGAVLQDMKHRIQDRFPVKHTVIDVLVQGKDSVNQIIQALQTFNNHPQPPDVIILARGGGSFEDLASFQDLNLCLAIKNSTIPVVSAIGHETDHSLTDLVADLRAPTPTAAIELILPTKQSLVERTQQLFNTLQQLMNTQHLKRTQRFDLLIKDIRTLATTRLQLKQQQLTATERLLSYDLMLKFIYQKHIQFQRTQHKLKQTLQQVIYHYNRQQQHHRNQLEQWNQTLPTILKHQVHNYRQQLSNLANQLTLLNPYAPLDKGYALVSDGEGNIIKSTTQIQPQRIYQLQLQDGTVAMTPTLPSKR